MPGLSVAQIVDKQIKRAQNAVDDYKSGVMNTKKNPMKRAIAKKDKMRKNILAAIDNGDWEAGLAATSDADWKAVTAKKGGDRFADGVAQSRATLVEFHTQRKAHQDSLSAEIEAMPDSSEQDMKNRMSAQFDGMKQFKFRKRSRQ